MSLIDPSARYFMTEKGAAVYREDLVDSSVRATRPVVVIDPEDAEQVERLLFALPYSVHPEDIPTAQAALRSLIAPPKRVLGAHVDCGPSAFTTFDGVRFCDACGLSEGAVRLEVKE